MFVVWIGAGQREIVGMRLWIIPIQFLAAAPHLIAISLDDDATGIPGEDFVHG
jgi:hypothetical protein